MKSATTWTCRKLEFRPQVREEVRDFRQKLKSDWKFDTGEYERSKDITLLDIQPC